MNGYRPDGKQRERAVLECRHGADGVRDARVKIEQTRPNVFRITATGPELSALVAGARMALDALRVDPEAPPEAVGLLERVLRDYDRALRDPPPAER